MAVTPVNPCDLSWVRKYKEIVIPSIAIFGTVFGVVFPYLRQKNKELGLVIAQQKRRTYARFLRNFTDISVAVMHGEDVSGKSAD